MRKEISVKALAEHGFDVTKLFAPGTSFKTTDHGTILFEEDETSRKIDEAGAVNSPRLFRRWVMAQMFRALNWKSYDRREEGYDAYYRINFPYYYQWKTLLDELHALNKIRVTDEYQKRSRFFTKDVVVKMAKDYEQKLLTHIREQGKCTKNLCVEVNGVPVDACLLNRIHEDILWIENATNRELERTVRTLMKDMIMLPEETPKSSAWKAAFKGEGSYYTLQNLILFHGLRVCQMDTARESMDYVEYLTTKYSRTGEWYKLFAFMRKVIFENRYDFYRDMEEKYRYRQ